MHKLLQLLTQKHLIDSNDTAKIYHWVNQQHIPIIYAVQIVIAKTKEKTLPQVINNISNAYNLPIFLLHDYNLAELPLHLISRDIIEQAQILPISLVNNLLTLAITNPENQDIINDIKFQQNRNIRLLFISLEDFRYTLITHNNHHRHNIDTMDNNPEVISLCNKILQDAIIINASDIHLEPTSNNQLKIRYRIDGDMLLVKTLKHNIKDAIIARLKLLANLDVAEKRLSQDGRLNFKLSEHQNKSKSIEFRVSTLNCIFGEKIVLRIMGYNIDTKISNLGLSCDQEIILKNHLNKSQGMILVTGPTGSGKSLTVYSCLNYLNDHKKNIMTAEDPVEMIIEGINQVNIHEKIGITFPSILRTFLRQDPDIIMVGEIRDQISAQLAINAAQTGHLILSTLHSNNCISTITRLLNLGIPSYNIADSLSLVIAQRLVKKLCESCKRTSQVSPEILDQLHKKLSISPGQIKIINQYQANGCKKCNGTGYNGRTAIFELLPINEDIRQLINGQYGSTKIYDYFMEQKYHSIYDQALIMFSQGLIDLQEIQHL